MFFCLLLFTGKVPLFPPSGNHSQLPQQGSSCKSNINGFVSVIGIHQLLLWIYFCTLMLLRGIQKWKKKEKGKLEFKWLIWHLCFLVKIPKRLHKREGGKGSEIFIGSWGNWASSSWFDIYVFYLKKHGGFTWEWGRRFENINWVMWVLKLLSDL